jgi:ketosteroid isomerase-like protein
VTITHLDIYEVLEVLGDGGMGTVYKARDPRFDRLVAIKVLHPHFARDPEVVARFKAEAIIQAKLSHPNIVAVYDFVATSSELAMILEYVDGLPLDRWIEAEHGPIGANRAVRIMDHVVSAIAHAHQQGLVHRDIKPSNIMVQSLSEERVAKVLDFGVAKILGSAKFQTATRAKVGTLAYMSPEHIRSPRSVDARSDIYSLGVILYEMLAGTLPFDADSEYELEQKIIQEPAPPLTRADALLASIVGKALQKNPAERFQTCHELRSAVQQWKHHDVMPEAAARATAQGEGNEVPTGARVPRRRHVGWVLAAAITIVLSVGGATLLRKPQRASTADEIIAAGAALSLRPPAPNSNATLSPSHRALRIDILALLASWRSAWSQRDIDAYMTFYAPSFVAIADDGSVVHRRAWAADKSAKFARAKFINVQVTDTEITEAGADLGIVSFTQLYSSDRHSDVVKKRLVIARQSDGSLRIEREESVK